MSTQFAQPTPYPDINAVLYELLGNVQTVLGNRFIGMYLGGSLAAGDFDPQTSDIDFVVITTDELPNEMLSALAVIHARMAASGRKWGTKLEGAYIPQHTFRRYDPAFSIHPSVSTGGGFGLDGQGSDAIIQRHILREQGIVVTGPAPQTLIDPILPDDLRRAEQATLQEWWAPQLEHPFRLSSREYQAYAVLTMCRALYTLQFGTVVTKPVAAAWAQQAVDEPWAALIERALTWEHEDGVDDVNGTLDFIRQTLGRSRRYNIKTDER
jgi:hypothetical protein